MKIITIDAGNRETSILILNIDTGNSKVASTSGFFEDQAKTILSLILSEKPEKVFYTKGSMSLGLVKNYLVYQMTQIGMNLKGDGSVVYQKDKSEDALFDIAYGRTISEILNEYTAFSAAHLEIVLNKEETKNALKVAELLESPLYMELVNEHIEKIGNQNKAKMDKISHDAACQYVKYLEAGLKSIILAYQPEITELTTHEELINEVNRTEYLKKYWIEFYESQIADAKELLKSKI